MKLAVLGVGLIGGSIGLAARRRAGAHVCGYDPDEQVLAQALACGAIDRSVTDVAAAVEGAEVVFVAAPVGDAVRAVRAALGAAGPECAVSDVGSTKRQIAREVSDPRFVGGHPLAGAETAGVRGAREDLFDGATWYLTPVPDTAPWALERVHGVIERIGARPVAIDPAAHDRLMASVSHLPHVLANVLVAQAARAVAADERALDHGELGAGPSFRDATRVAGANTAIWTDIYVSNGDLLAEALDATIAELERVREALAAADAHALAAWNERARAQRERLRQAGPASDS